MKIYQQRELKEAVAEALAGKQVLYLLSGSFAYMQDRTPNCFKGQAQIGKIFDQDKERLIKLVKKLGVKKILVDREGEPYQHIDLCRKPLEKAIALFESM